MKIIYISFFTFFTCFLTAQTKADFENFIFTKDTFLNGKGGPNLFVSGNIGLPVDYNKDFDAWTGWSISNVKDNATPGYGNQYSAITGGGAEGSKNYAVTYVSGSSQIYLQGSARGGVVNGLYLTNSTYAALSMKSGDAFSKKFGGATGNDPDYYSVKIKGWNKGSVTKDSVVVFLADFRSPDNTKDFISNKWEYVSLVSLGALDSLNFTVASSDVGAFGINTPTYFCIDQLSTANGITPVQEQEINLLSLYPNPAHEYFIIDEEQDNKDLYAVDIYGKSKRLEQLSKNKYSVDDIESGIYFIKKKQSIIGKINVQR